MAYRLRWEEAIDAAKKAQIVASNVKSFYFFAMGRALVAYGQWQLTKDASAISAIEESTHWLRSRNREQYLSLNYGWLADCAFSCNDEQRLKKYYALAVGRARVGDRLGYCMAARAMASFHRKGGNDIQTKRYLERALRVANQRNATHEISRIKLVSDSNQLDELL